MTTTDAITNTTGTQGGTSTNRNTSGTLGKDDFLKLLVGQMKNMDPLGAGNSDPSQSMAQMTQYSILEQLTNLNNTTRALADQTTVASTLGLMGRTVSYSEADGTTVEGTVESIQTAGGKLSLTVGGKPGIDPDRVLEVR